MSRNCSFSTIIEADMLPVGADVLGNRASGIVKQYERVLRARALKPIPLRICKVATHKSPWLIQMSAIAWGHDNIQPWRSCY